MSLLEIKHHSDVIFWNARDLQSPQFLLCQAHVHLLMASHYYKYEERAQNMQWSMNRTSCFIFVPVNLIKRNEHKVANSVSVKNKWEVIHIY